MLDITPRIAANAQLIEQYGNGGFLIGSVQHSGSVIVFPEATLAWDVRSPEQITRESLQAALDHQPGVELLLIGTGAGQFFIPPSFRRSLGKIAMDAMDTGAACRTFNILLAEQRRVAAALIAV